MTWDLGVFTHQAEVYLKSWRFAQWQEFALNNYKIDWWGCDYSYLHRGEALAHSVAHETLKPVQDPVFFWRLITYYQHPHQRAHGSGPSHRVIVLLDRSHLHTVTNLHSWLFEQINDGWQALLEHSRLSEEGWQI